MKNKAMRGLATLLAVLMIVLVMPIGPIFGAATDINSITLKKPTNQEELQLVFYDIDNNGLEEGILWDFFDTYKDEPDITKPDAGDILIGKTTYTLSYEGEDAKITKKDSAFSTNFNIGICTIDENLICNVSDGASVNQTTGLKLSEVDGSEGGMFAGKIQLGFGKFGAFKSAKGDLTVEFSIPAPTHTVNWSLSGEYQLLEYGESFDAETAKGLTPGMKVEEKDGSASFTFVLHVDDSTKTPVVKYTIGNDRQQVVNNESLAVDKTGYYKYTISNITDDVNVLINLYDALTVSWNTGTGYSATGSHSIAYNSKDSYTITVTPDPGYVIKSVTAGGSDFPNGVSLLSGDDNVYTLTAPEGGFRYSVTISIIAEKKTFTVSSTTAATNDAFETTFSNQTREYGDSYTFTVDPKEGYNAPEVKVYKGGADVTTDQLKKSGNTYTIENITDDLTVVFAAGSQIEYTVTYPSSPLGYKLTVKKNGSESITSGTRVPHGTSLTIEVEVLDEYSKSIDGLTLTINNTRQDTQKDDSGKFTFNCTVKGDVSINVTGLSINTYTIDVPTKNVGYTVTGAPTGKVQHGESVTFTIVLSDGYKLSKTSDLESLFTINGDTPELTYNKDANTVTCKIVSITKDFSLEINEGSIEIIKYKVTAPKAGETKEYTVTLGGDEDKDGTAEITYDENVNFTVKPELGYVISAVSVKEKKADGSEGSSVPADVVSREAGTYVIKNVKSDYEINVEYKPITVTITYNIDTVSFNDWVIVDGRSVDKTYVFGEINNGFKVVDGSDQNEKLVIELYVEDTTGLTFGGWTANGYGSGGVVTQCDVKPNEQNQSFTFYGTYIVDVITSGDEQQSNSNLPFLAVDEGEHKTTVEKDEKNRGVFNSTLNLKLALVEFETGKVFKEAFENDRNQNTKVVACGMLYSQNKIDPSQYIQSIKDLHKSGDPKSGFISGNKEDPQSIYCYYYGEKDFGTFKLGETFTMRVNKPSGGGDRYGVMWFLVKIGGEEFLFFGQCEECDFDA